LKLRLRYFAALREALGVSDETIDVPDDLDSVAAVLAWLRARGGVWDETFAQTSRLRCALNHHLVALDAPLPPAGTTFETGPLELAFFPPVTGG